MNYGSHLDSCGINVGGAPPSPGTGEVERLKTQVAELLDRASHPNRECLMHFHDAEVRGDRLEVEVERLREVMREVSASLSGFIGVATLNDMSPETARFLRVICGRLESAAAAEVSPATQSDASGEVPSCADLAIEDRELTSEQCEAVSRIREKAIAELALHTPAQSLANAVDAALNEASEKTGSLYPLYNVTKTTVRYWLLKHLSAVTLPVATHESAQAEMRDRCAAAVKSFIDDGPYESHEEKAVRQKINPKHCEKLNQQSATCPSRLVVFLKIE